MKGKEMERHRQAENTNPVFGNMFKLAWGKDLAVTPQYWGLLTHQEQPAATMPGSDLSQSVCELRRDTGDCTIDVSKAVSWQAYDYLM